MFEKFSPNFPLLPAGTQLWWLLSPHRAWSLHGRVAKRNPGLLLLLLQATVLSSEDIALIPRAPRITLFITWLVKYFAQSMILWKAW